MAIAIVQGLARGAVLAVVLFASARRVDLPFFWGFILVCTIMGVLAYEATRRHEGLMEEQLKPKGKGLDGAVSIAALVLMVMQWILAGRDVGHYHWTPPLPAWVQAAGLVGMAVAYGVGYWALCCNPFFSPVVRVQQERGHAVVDQGPYRFIRHPANLATCLGILSGGLALGSFVSLIPALAVCLLYIRRTRIEDEYLRSHLEGYEGYFQRVRYAMVPGVW